MFIFYCTYYFILFIFLLYLYFMLYIINYFCIVFIYLLIFLILYIVLISIFLIFIILLFVLLFVKFHLFLYSILFIPFLYLSTIENRLRVSNCQLKPFMCMLPILKNSILIIFCLNSNLTLKSQRIYERTT